MNVRGRDFTAVTPFLLDFRVVEQRIIAPSKRITRGLLSIRWLRITAQRFNVGTVLPLNNPNQGPCPRMNRVLTE